MVTFPSCFKSQICDETVASEGKWLRWASAWGLQLLRVFSEHQCSNICFPSFESAVRKPWVGSEASWMDEINNLWMSSNASGRVVLQQSERDLAQVQWDLYLKRCRGGEFMTFKWGRVMYICRNLHWCKKLHFYSGREHAPGVCWSICYQEHCDIAMKIEHYL